MFVVLNERNARGYALALLLITVATLFMVDAVRKRRRKDFVAYGATAVLSVCASPLTGFVLVARAASLPALPQVR
jgi:uncharacterized membrane protein